MTDPAPKKKLSPMLVQYLEYKDAHPDCLLFFQVGDFYEAFFEDAVTISGTLNLTLTSRDKNSPDPIPMAGVPLAVIDSYIERLVDAGFSVAIVSQAEPATPGKGMVVRKLDRIVTPGIQVLGAAEGDSDGAIVAALFPASDNNVALAFSVVESGIIQVKDQLSLSTIRSEIKRLQPREVILPREVGGTRLDRRLGWVRGVEHVVPFQGVKFRFADYDGRRFAELKGYSALAGAGKRAVRLLTSYIDETTVDFELPIQQVLQYSDDKLVTIDATARRTLELVENNRDSGLEGTLLKAIDRTKTGYGRRLLKQRVLSPLKDIDEINQRLDLTQELLSSFLIRQKLQELLRYTADLERIAVRIELGVVSPRECAALRETVSRVPEFLFSLSDLNSSLLTAIKEQLVFSSTVIELLESALVDNPPISLADGGIFKSGYDSELDRLREIKQKGTSWLTELETTEREKTGISSLKIKFNNVHGYFIEVTRANISKVPEHYIKRQTMVNAERFTTEQLKEREQEILGAGEKALAREKELFAELKQKLRQHTDEVRSVSKALAALDFYCSLAELAEAEGYTRPEFQPAGETSIVSGKHPVLSQLLKERFVPNSTVLLPAESNCLLITGPNMGGKSTYLRQTGLIIILAQLGSFVPAEKATIVPVDQIFARLGASDDLAEGESTFMVEMREMSQILERATDQSLLLIDEVGRGTATTDGLAIAQAILEWVVKHLSCRTLFATHFHQLTELERVHASIKNLSVGSTEQDGQVYFTHQICERPADRSYGVEVARLAGLPHELVQRASELLTELDLAEQGKIARMGAASAQLSIFSPSSVSPVGSKPSAEPEDYKQLCDLRDEINLLDINYTSPLDALTLLNDLKGRLKE